MNVLAPCLSLSPRRVGVFLLCGAMCLALSTAGSISAQTNPIWDDGFELGDTTRWDQVVGQRPVVTFNYPYQVGANPPVVGDSFRIAFGVENVVLEPGGFHLHLQVDGQQIASWSSYDPIPVDNLADGSHELLLTLRNPDHSATGHSVSQQVVVDQARMSSTVVPGQVSTGTLRPNPRDLGYLPRPAAGAIVPPCATHNRNEYHALFDPVRGCYYDHEHKDDPTRVNDIFGAPWAWLPGQHQSQLETSRTIGYPWQTWRGLDQGLPPQVGNFENDGKHEGYGWMVRRTQDYPGFECFSAFADLCITDHRYQFHAVAGLSGAPTRYHSFWLEARVCQESDPTDCGIIRSGGHVDFAELNIDEVHVPLPWDPPNLSSSGRRLHGGLSPSSIRQTAKDFTWYPQARLVSLSVRGSSWNPVETADLGQPWFYCADPTACRWPNGDMMESHLTLVNSNQISFLDGSARDLDGQVDGHLTFLGYTDRHGMVRDEGACDAQALGPDCVPLSVEGLPLGAAQYRDDTHGLDEGIALYDTAPLGQFWIQYPN